MGEVEESTGTCVVEHTTGTWVVQRCRCAPPTQTVTRSLLAGGRFTSMAAVGSAGDLWRCDVCRTLWVVEPGFLALWWSRANRWHRLRAWWLEVRHRG